MIRALLACAAWIVVSASDIQACENQQAHSKSLLQVHGTAELVARNDDEVGLCVVQDDSCFDMQLDKRWRNPSTSEEFNFSHDAVQLVVARHGEDLRWLDALRQLPAVVYNRGGPDSLLPAARENLQLVVEENTGREDEVFLHHIVENYDTLPQVTIFLQGWPFGHCPGFLKAVRSTVIAMLQPDQVAELQGVSDAGSGSSHVRAAPPFSSTMTGSKATMSLSLGGRDEGASQAEPPSLRGSSGSLERHSVWRRLHVEQDGLDRSTTVSGLSARLCAAASGAVCLGVYQASRWVDPAAAHAGQPVPVDGRAVQRGPLVLPRGISTGS